MAKLTLEELYNGDEYSIHSHSVVDYLKNYGLSDSISQEDETHILILLTVKHTVAATIKMIKQGDFVEDFESEMKSLSLCPEVNINE